MTQIPIHVSLSDLVITVSELLVVNEGLRDIV